ncbi:MAG: hypothetical protein WED10_14635, partial [Brumimicrobium sp.]
MLIAAFAFGATSYISNVEVNKPYSVNISKDSLINHIERLDSVNFVNRNLQSTTNPDTMKISFPSNLCFDNVEINIIIEEHTDGTSTITLQDAKYDCPKEKNEQDKVIKGFEDKVINQVDF